MLSGDIVSLDMGCNTQMPLASSHIVPATTRILRGYLNVILKCFFLFEVLASLEVARKLRRVEGGNTPASVDERNHIKEEHTQH